MDLVDEKQRKKGPISHKRSRPVPSPTDSWYTVQVKLMDSVSLSAFLARRVLQGMVVPFPKDATQTRGADKLTRRALPWRPADSVAALIKGTTIDGALRLAAKRHESAESINLTWTVY